MRRSFPLSVLAMVEDSTAPVAPLEDFLEVYREDPSIWWRTTFEHQRALFEQAIGGREENRMVAEECDRVETGRSGVPM